MIDRLRSADALVSSLWEQPRGLVSTAALRIGLGAVGLLYYLSHFLERRFFFGPDGVWSWEVFRGLLSDTNSFSLYALSQSLWWFEVLYFLGIAAALACITGVGGRLGVAVHWVMLWSIYQRNPALLDGGDNLAYVLLPFLALTASTRTLTLWTGRRRRQPDGVQLGRPVSTAAALGPTATFIHNMALIVIIGQICIVYLVSGLYKFGGELWINGTALYYILRTPEFMWDPVSPMVFTNGPIVTLGTYGAMFLLAFLPLLVLNRSTRATALFAVMGLHLSIAVLMGLWGFALTMIVCDLVLLGDDHLIRMGARIRSRVLGQDEPDTWQGEEPEQVVPVLAPDAGATMSPEQHDAQTLERAP